MPDRRSTARGGIGEGFAGRRARYFAFQGLLAAVLLLVFVYQYRGIEGWVHRFYFLTGLSGGSLLLLQLASARTLESWYFQVGLFLGDATLASLVLHWSHPDSDFYLLYFLIIFGTALTRSLAQSVIVAVVTSALYMLSAWHPYQGLPHSAAFWSRVFFLWVTSGLMAILSRDSRQAQHEIERGHQERMVQFERLAALGQLAGEVAHRIKGPLTTIMVNAEVLAQRGDSSPQAQKELAEIRDEVGHCRDILKSLLDLGRIEEMDRVAFDLRDPLRQALESVAARARRHKIDIEESLPKQPLSVRGDPSLVQEAVMAVLHNALDAARSGGRIRVAARISPGPRDWSHFFRRPRVCSIFVEDDGRGIRSEDRERIFQPFFTTKGQYGSGLGLSAALRVMQKHGGTIEAHSRGLGQGARFILSLPCRLPARGRYA